MTIEHPISPADIANPPDEDEISLLDLVITLAKHKKLVLGLPAVAAVVSIIVSLLMTPVYTSTIKLLPPAGQQSSAAAMLSQLGGLAGMAGAAAGIKNPADLYIAMLKSRTLGENMVTRFDLMNLYETKFRSDARKGLEGATKIAAGKDGIITIEVEDTDPKRAADIANAYAEELTKLTNVLAVTEASQRRLFFERQLQQAKDNLAKAEIAARRAINKDGIANIDIQGRTMIETTARMRGQIAAKEVQIGAMHGFAAEHNPDLIRAQQELSALKRELARIEGAGGHTTVDGSAEGLDSLRLLRDLKYFETVYEMLAKQFELAKIDEAKESTVVQVLDRAVEPDRKSKPKRAMIVLLSTLAAGFMGILAAFIREAFEKARGNPDSAERIQTLRRYLSWKH